MRVCLRALVLSSLLAGCGAALDDPSAGAPGSADGKGDGPGTGTGPGSGSEPTAGEFLIKIGEIQCDHAFACRSSYPGGGNAFVRVFGANQSVCYADAVAYYEPTVVDGEIQRGNIAYDATAAAQCLEGTSLGASCDDYWQNGTRFDPACDRVLIGKIADGDDCECGFDCAGATSICDADLGVCVAD